MGDLGKLIVAKGFKKLPKVQNIAQSGHTAFEQTLADTEIFRQYAGMDLKSKLAASAILFFVAQIRTLFNVLFKTT